MIRDPFKIIQAFYLLQSCKLILSQSARLFIQNSFLNQLQNLIFQDSFDYFYYQMDNKQLSNKGQLQSKTYMNEFQQKDPQHEEENKQKIQQPLSSEEVTLITEQNANIFPYNCIGMLIFRIQSGDSKKGFGTGFLIGPNLVLTAAHNTCEFIDGELRQYSNLQFLPGISANLCLSQTKSPASLNGSNMHGIKIKSKKIPNNFNAKCRIQHDYALLKLEKDIFRQEYIELGSCYQYVNEQLYTISYEDICNEENRKFHLKEVKKYQSYQIKDNIRLQYQFKTFFGYSGAPILVKRQNKFIAVAIHKGILIRQKRISIPYQQRKSMGRIISNELLANLLKWQKQLYLQEFVSRIKAHQIKEKSIEKISILNGKQAFLQFIDQVQSNHKKMIQNECNNLKEIIGEMIKKLEKIGEEKLHYESLAMKSINPEQASNNEYKEVQVVQQSADEFQFKHIQKKEQIKSPLKSTLKLSTQTTTNHQLQERITTMGSSVKLGSQFWDLTLPFASKYQVKNNKIILKHDDYSRYQLTSRKPLLLSTTTSFYIEKYGGQRDICLGIITEDRKKCQNSGNNQESLGFWFGNNNKIAKIICDGELIDDKEYLQVLQLSTISMQVDLYSMKVFLYTYLKKIEVNIPEYYKEKNLYIFVVLANRNDTISMFI